MQDDRLEKLTRVGHQMSNVCFNLGQAGAPSYEGPQERKKVKQLAKDWDQALADYREFCKSGSPDEGVRDNAKVCRSTYLCAKKRWSVGSMLEGSEFNGNRTVVDRIEILYIGNDMVVAKRVAIDGKEVDGRERSWDLTFRNWKRVK
jgi:hypothetical protein